MTQKEYDALLSKKRQAEQAAQRIKYEAEKSIQRIKNDAQHKIYQANTEAKQQVDAMAQELAEAQAEATYQRELNANLIRIAKERANAERKLKPKKEHSGFVVVSSIEKECRYKDGNRHWRRDRINLAVFSVFQWNSRIHICYRAYGYSIGNFCI